MAKSKRGKHTSVDKELKKSIKWLEGLDCVKKVVFSSCESCRHSFKPGTIRYSRDESAGVKLIGHGGTGIMNIFVKVEDENKEAFLELLKSKFKENLKG